jgi:hypothetical protein
VLALIKAVEQAEVTGWAVSVQDVAEARASAVVSASIKAVEQAEVTGWAVSVQDVAEAMVETLLRRIKEDVAEKNTYIGISFTHLQQDGITHLAVGFIIPVQCTGSDIDSSLSAINVTILEHSSADLTNKVYTNVDPVLCHVVDQIPANDWL